MTYEELMRNAIPVLVNVDLAKRMKKDGVKLVKKLDFYVGVAVVDEDGVRFVNQDLEGALGVTFAKILKGALNNAAQKGTAVGDLSEMVGGEAQAPVSKVVRFHMDLFGASVMLMPKEVFGPIAEELDADLIVLPSSVHEVIVMQLDEDRVDDLRDTVRTINAASDVIRANEVLSNNVYAYRKDMGKLEVL